MLSLFDLKGLILISLVLVALTLVYGIGKVTYNIFFHPLRNFPGPKLWGATRIPHSIARVRGNIHYRVADFHEKYGDVVRITPSDLSFISPDAWNDIYGFRTGKGGQLVKNQLGLVLPPSGVHGILTTPSNADHGRMRKNLSNSFSDKALREQQPLIMHYVDKMIDRLNAKCKDGPLDILAWFNYTTFDIIGDLTFGESFGSLDTYVDWIEQFTIFTQSLTLNSVTENYRPFSGLLQMLIPERLKLRNMKHRSNSYAKLARRLDMKETRPDFISHLLPKYETPQGFSKEELKSTASLLTIAGSETTATLLSGVVYHLTAPTTSPHILAQLKEEIRSAFTNEEDITMVSVNSLTYQLAVLDEALRIFPPVVMGAARVTGAEGSVIAGRYVPKNIHVGVSQYAAYLSERNWTRPREFVPERWLGAEEFKNDKRGVLQPFHVGPRNCIGRNLAYAEMRLVLAKLIWNFDIELMDESKGWLTDFKAYALWSKKPLMVKLTPVH